MNYLVLASVVLAGWLLCVFWGILFYKRVGNGLPEYSQSLVENANNIFVYGLLGMLAVFLSAIFGGWVTYIAVLLYGLGSVIVFLRLGTALITTLMLMFDNNYNGIKDMGRALDWLILMSMLTEAGIMVFFVIEIWLAKA